MNSIDDYEIIRRWNIKEDQILEIAVWGGMEEGQWHEKWTDEVYVVRWKYCEALRILQHPVNVKRSATTAYLELVSSTYLI